MSAKTTKCKNVNGLHLSATRCILGAARKIEPSCLMPFSNRQLLNLYTSLQILGPVNAVQVPLVGVYTIEDSAWPV